MPIVRVKEATHAQLKELSERCGVPMGDLLERAVAALASDALLDEVNASFGRLRVDADAWAEYREELGAWETTLADGLDEAP